MSDLEVNEIGLLQPPPKDSAAFRFLSTVKAEIILKDTQIYSRVSNVGPVKSVDGLGDVPESTAFLRHPEKMPCGVALLCYWHMCEIQ